MPAKHPACLSLLVSALLVGIVLIIITACSPAPSTIPTAGTTYYVAQSGGSDSNPGTQSQPFQTIQKGADVAKPGDTVLIHAGSYGKFSVSTSGTQGQPIAIRAYPGEKPVVSETGGGGVITLSNVSYIILDGMTVQNGGVGIRITGAQSANNRVLNCEVSKARSSGIGIYEGAHNNLVKNCLIHDNAQGNWPRGAASMWASGMSAAHGAQNNVFEDNYIYWNHGEGTSAFDGSDGTVWRRNVIADNWSENLYVDGSKDCVIEDNLIYLTPEAKQWNSNFNNNAQGIGVSVESYPDQPTITRDATGLKISNNIVVNTSTGIGSFVEESGHTFSGWVVTNNTFLNNDFGIKLQGQTASNTFRDNIVFGGSPVVDVPAGAGVFANNVYYGSAQSFQWGGTAGDFTQWQGLSGETNSQWADPIFQNSSAIPPRFWSDPSLPAPSAIVPLSTLLQPYQLAAGSPAKKASDTGGEVGAYGGTSGGVQAR